MRARDALKSNTCLVKCIKINPARLLCPTHTISARTSRPASRPSADFGASIYGAGQVSERPSARIMGRARPQTYQFSIHQRSSSRRRRTARRVDKRPHRRGWAPLAHAPMACKGSQNRFNRRTCTQILPGQSPELVRVRARAQAIDRSRPLDWNHVGEPREKVGARLLPILTG